jgi:predicted small metal-binding protein
MVIIRNVDFTSLSLERRLVVGGPNMEAHETVVLCPNCRWSARGQNEQELSEAKDRHAMYECPLPSVAAAHLDALAS